MNKEAEINRIREENQQRYGATEETSRLLETLLPRTFPAPWIFLFELTQNAVDVGAEQVRLTIRPGTLVFEHDGKTRLELEHVRALSKLGMSTKKLDSVGFMGVGFKSVFQRFRTARISGNGWRFRFHIGLVQGPRGAELQEWLGTVLPNWDVDVPAPDEPFTTAFYLSDAHDTARRLEEDILEFANPANPATLAVLAVRGLRKLTINGQTWQLIHDATSHDVRVIIGDQVFRWCALIRAYTPSEEAIRCLLEFRRTRSLSAEDIEKLEHERQVLALVPLASTGAPFPLDRGVVYATLPTSETLPLGMHIQADWFVDITRRGLVSIRGNLWQEQIVEQIPLLVADYLRWLIGQPRSRTELRNGFKALGAPSRDMKGEMDPALDAASLRNQFAAILQSLAFLPRHGGAKSGFLAPSQAVFLPLPLAAPFGEHPEWAADILFDGPIVDTWSLGERGSKFLSWLRLETTLAHSDLTVRWPPALKRWWAQLGSTDVGLGARRRALFALWSGLAALVNSTPGWLKLPCVPTEAGEWAPVTGIRYIDMELPAESAPGGAQVRELIKGVLPRANEQVPLDVFRLLRAGVQGERDDDRRLRQEALEWFKRHAVLVELKSVIQQACADVVKREPLCWDNLIYLAEWARHQNQAQFVEYLVVDTPEGKQRAVPPTEALIGEPYVASGAARILLFQGLQPVSEYYLVSSTSVDAGEWRALFEKLGARGALQLERTSHHLWDKESVAAELGIKSTEVQETNQRSGYSIVDFHFNIQWPPTQLEALAPWLEAEHASLHGRGKKRAISFYQYERITLGSRPCSWVERLNALSWVPTDQGRLLRPTDCLAKPSDDYENAPLARLTDGLIKTLQKEGIIFGNSIPKSAAVRRLALGAIDRSPSELASLLREARAEVGDEEEGLKQLRLTINTLVLPVKDGRVPFSRLVNRTGSGVDSRSSLGGFVAALADLSFDLRCALLACPVPPLPETTTGEHALAFLKDVWSRAQRNDTSLSVDEIRRYLPLAYAYVLDDAASNPDLMNAWNKALSNAMVYGRSGWHATSNRPFVDDLSDARVRSIMPTATITVTPGHLGDTIALVRRTAKALGLPLLSEHLNPIWSKGQMLAREKLTRHFALLKDALDQLTNRAGEGVLGIEIVDSLKLQVQNKNFKVHARIFDRKLVVTGTPDEFMDEAAVELVEAYTLGQRGAAVAVLAGVLLALDDESRFIQKLERLAELLDVKVDLSKLAAPPLPTQALGMPAHSPDGPSRGSTAADSHPDNAITELGGRSRDVPGSSETSSSGHDGSASTSSTGSRGDRTGDGHGSGRKEHDGETERKPRKETPAGTAPDMRTFVRAKATAAGEGSEHAWKSDARSRSAAMAHEYRKGRIPTEMPFDNEGFDIKSVDPTSGRIRRIEVKGTSGIWKDKASVILSSRQFEDPRRTQEPVEHWLYVVDSEHVFPIPWAERGISGYVFYAEDWEIFAVEKEPIEHPTTSNVIPPEDGGV